MALALNAVIFSVGILAVPIWVFGVPGVQNEYARMWQLSLGTLLIYVGFTFVLLVISIVKEVTKKKGKVAGTNRFILEKLTAVAFLVFLLIQIYAFSNM